MDIFEDLYNGVDETAITISVLAAAAAAAADAEAGSPGNRSGASGEPGPGGASSVRRTSTFEARAGRVPPTVLRLRPGGRLAELQALISSAVGPTVIDLQVSGRAGPPHVEPGH